MEVEALEEIGIQIMRIADIIEMSSYIFIFGLTVIFITSIWKR